MTTEQINRAFLDAANWVAAYRDALRRAEAATTKLGRAEWEGVARRLRRRWQAWQGEDSLHEASFGERDATER
jgi:hypothetical protein